MIVADYVAQFLARKGITDVFFLDGSAIACMLVGVANNKRLKYWCPLHEQAGSFMVDGYYKASHKPAAMFVTSGPGGQNILNGLAASYYDSIPALYFTGQINSRFIKPNNKVRQHGFQEHEVLSMVQSSIKYSVQLIDVTDLRYQLERMWHEATTGRPGPVLMDIPMDVQRAEVPKLMKGFIDHKVPIGFKDSNTPVTGLGKIDKIVEWLGDAKRPAILLGGGVWLSGAVEEAKKLARKLKYVPFFITWNMMDYYDPEFCAGKVGTFGGDGRNFGIQNCDLLITIGSRISGRITGGMMNTFARDAKKIIVDIDKTELKFQQVTGDMNVCCDAKEFIQGLIKKVRRSYGDTEWIKQTKAWRDKYKVVRPEYAKQKDNVNPYYFVKKLSDLMKEGDILVHEAGGNCVITSQAFEQKDGQRVFTNNGNSSLGYALPAAIGAAIANPGKNVICICGDGGLNFNIQEFQTIKHYNLPVKLLIFNNKAYGITKAYRDTHFKSNYAGVDAAHGMSSPDFVAVARAYGISSLRIESHKDLKLKLFNTLDVKGAVVCDIDMEGFYSYTPKLGWGTPIEDQYPFLPRKEFKKNMFIKPWDGWLKPQYPGPIK